MNGAAFDCPAPQLLPEAQPVVAAYMLCSTQWRYGMAGRTGLDYTACRAALRPHREALGMTFDELLPDLQVLEREILAAEHDVRERTRESTRK